MKSLQNGGLCANAPLRHDCVYRAAVLRVVRSVFPGCGVFRKIPPPLLGIDDGYTICVLANDFNVNNLCYQPIGPAGNATQFIENKNSSMVIDEQVIRETSDWERRGLLDFRRTPVPSNKLNLLSKIKKQILN